MQAVASSSLGAKTPPMTEAPKELSILKAENGFIVTEQRYAYGRQAKTSIAKDVAELQEIVLAYFAEVND